MDVVAAASVDKLFPGVAMQYMYMYIEKGWMATNVPFANVFSVNGVTHENKDTYRDWVVS